MLVLTRRANESIVINGDIVITILEAGRNGQVRIGIEAPRHYQIYRKELLGGSTNGESARDTKPADSERQATTDKHEPTPLGQSQT